jgi:hypothetical protein|tara:strand:- start:7077 stop:7484 length:408 start_codon:yes stop_codon:yes gene_type:complete
MSNAKEELLGILGLTSSNIYKRTLDKGNEHFTIVAAKLSFQQWNNGDLWESDGYITNKFLLKEGHTASEWNTFLNDINFEYDDGFGGQELFGTVYCTDGVWFTRGEYDGSEWWEQHCYPTMSYELQAEEHSTTTL